jgi:hypothetical protein
MCLCVCTFMCMYGKLKIKLEDERRCAWNAEQRLKQVGCTCVCVCVCTIMYMHGKLKIRLEDERWCMCMCVCVCTCVEN